MTENDFQPKLLDVLKDRGYDFELTESWSEQRGIGAKCPWYREKATFSFEGWEYGIDSEIRYFSGGSHDHQYVRSIIALKVGLVAEDFELTDGFDVLSLFKKEKVINPNLKQAIEKAKEQFKKLKSTTGAHVLPISGTSNKNGYELKAAFETHQHHNHVLATTLDQIHELARSV